MKAKSFVGSAILCMVLLFLLVFSIKAEDQRNVPNRNTLSPSTQMGAILLNQASIPIGPLPMEKPSASSLAHARITRPDDPSWNEVVFQQRVVFGADALKAPEISKPSAGDDTETLRKKIVSGLFIIPRKDAPAGQGFFQVILPKEISDRADGIRAMQKSIAEKMDQLDKAMVRLAYKHNINVYDVRNLANDAFSTSAYANAALRDRLAEMGHYGETFERMRRNAYWQVSQSTIGRFTEFSAEEEQSGMADSAEDSQGAKSNLQKLNCTQLDEIHQDIQNIKNELLTYVLKNIHAR